MSLWVNMVDGPSEAQNSKRRNCSVLRCSSTVAARRSWNAPEGETKDPEMSMKEEVGEKVYSRVKEWPEHPEEESKAAEISVKEEIIEVPLYGRSIEWTEQIEEETKDAETLPSVLDGKFYFKKNRDGTFDKQVVICTYCKKAFSFHRSYSSLKYHLNAKHASADASACGASGATTPSTSRLRRAALTERRVFSKPVSDKLSDAIARWIAVDCRPISVVEDKGFEEVLKVATLDPSYTPPPRATTVAKIQELFDTARKEKEEDLTRLEYVALTGDHWTNVSNESFLGVTAHVITEAWELKSFALTVLKTEERHFADMRGQFLSVARSWAIEGKITTIGMDCARNMASTETLLPFEQIPCVAHILQRSVTVSLADSGFDNVLAKARKLVDHFKHSPADAMKLEVQQWSCGLEQVPLIQDASTRWNSTLEMVKSLNHNQAAVTATLDSQDEELVILSPSEWDELQRLETLLEPCRDVTELLGGEAYTSCSVVLPALCHLRHIMEANEDDPTCVVKFKTTFKDNLTSRQANANNTWLKLATALDPRFKDLKCLPKSEREEVWATLGAILDKQSPRGRHAVQTSGGAPPRKKVMIKMESDSESDDDMQPVRDLHRYRAEPRIQMEECPLKWWSTHSGAHDKLALLARKYLSTPASTVPCERLFSVAGNIVHRKRSALLSENVDQMVCLSDWLKEQ